MKRLLAIVLCLTICAASRAEPPAATQPAFTHTLTLTGDGKPKKYRVALPDGWEQGGVRGVWQVSDDQPRPHPIPPSACQIDRTADGIEILLSVDMTDVHFAATLKPAATAGRYVGTWSSSAMFGDGKTHRGQATLKPLVAAPATKPS